MYSIGPWLFCLLITAGSLLQVLDGSLHHWREGEAPSCEQLRAFWDIISRTVRMSEITNEIPVIPMDFFSSFDPELQSTSQRRKPIKNSIINVEPYISKNLHKTQSRLKNGFEMLGPHDDHQMTSNNNLKGVFGDFHSLPEVPSSVDSQWHFESEAPFIGPSSVIPGEKKNMDNEEFFEPQWGEPEEVGMFGRFVDLVGGSLHQTRVPKDSTENWPELPFVMESSLPTQGNLQLRCSEIINKDCFSETECICSGRFFLECSQGKCRVSSNDNSYHYSTWHDGPLPRSKLGRFSRLKRRSIRSIFM